MKTVAINLPEELADEVQVLLQKRLEKSRAEATLLEAQLKTLRGMSPGVIHQPRLSQKIAARSARHFNAKRQSKDEVKSIVLNHLANLNGDGIGLTDLLKELGTSYSTTFRSLQDLKREGRAVNTNAKWKLLH